MINEWILSYTTDIAEETTVLTRFIYLHDTTHENSENF